MLRVDSVSISFDKPLLTDTSLEVQSGHGVVIGGPNGIGKSTLLKMIVGLLTPSSGRVLLDGAPLDRQRARVGYCPAATYGFYRRLTPRQNLHFFGSLYGLTPKLVDRKLASVDFFGIDYWSHPLERLSEGMLQKIKIVRAFLHEPDLVVLDEPLNFLDARSKAQTLEWLRAWRAAKPGRASVLTQHGTELPGLTDAVWRIAECRLTPEGAP